MSRCPQDIVREKRRRNVASLLRQGRMIHEIASQLKLPEETVRRDINALRLAAAAHKPWDNPAACAAAFVESAEEALQKVRAAQEDAETTSTAYVNLVKLEWTMLVKFIELLSPKRGAARPEDLDDPDDFTRLSNQQLIAKGRELGVDITAFEHALTAAAPADPDDDADDLDEAA